MDTYVWIIIIVLVNVTISSFAVWNYRKKLFLQYDSFLQRVDRILSGERMIESYDEALDSAISEKLNRIVEMTELQKEKAETERDTVKALISDISHQIRTPLANITLYTGLLREELTDEKSIHLLNKIENNAEKLDFHMKELIKSSYTEQELISVNASVVEIDDLIKRGCQAVELAAMKKNVKIHAAYHGYKGYADSKWMEEVLGNIIENAVKYSPEASSIEVDSILYETFVCIQITDQGIGIPEEEQGKVFQRFYRASNVKEEPGFGIGLYLAREIMSRQQGYVKMKSCRNKGTKVELFLLKEQC